VKVVHVKWVDPAFGGSGWTDKDTFEAAIKRGLSRGDSVGMLAYECPEFVIVLQTVGNDQVAEWVKIARPCITEIKELCEVDITLKLDVDAEKGGEG
jgi:hypothetical protein